MTFIQITNLNVKCAISASRATPYRTAAQINNEILFGAT